MAAPPPVRPAPLTVRFDIPVPLRALTKVMVGLPALETIALPSKTVDRALSAAWMLPCKIAELALQPMGSVVWPLKESVKVPPVTPGSKTNVCTTLAVVYLTTSWCGPGIMRGSVPCVKGGAKKGKMVVRPPMAGLPPVRPVAFMESSKLVPCRILSNVTIWLAAGATVALPTPTVVRALSAAWMLAWRIDASGLQAIAAVVWPLKERVKAPPVMPLKIKMRLSLPPRAAVPPTRLEVSKVRGSVVPLKRPVKAMVSVERLDTSEFPLPTVTSASRAL